jgi:methylthioribose-1-phosphate isomerase
VIEITRVNAERAAPGGATALNPAFDVTPNALVTVIVTERGVLRPAFGDAIAALAKQPAVAR